MEGGLFKLSFIVNYNIYIFLNSLSDDECSVCEEGLNLELNTFSRRCEC